MDRHAVFVDAGFLLSGAGSLCLGVQRRTEMEADYEGLIGRLKQLAEGYSHLPLLRLYWYDGALGGEWTKQQEQIARVPDVKLRLGRVVRGQQKGVDSLIVRDLMTLSRNRAVADMVLVGGDEDLRAGMVEAQDQGVRVVVFTLSSATTAASHLLLREADDVFVLGAEDLAPFVRRAPEVADVLQRARTEGVMFAEGWLRDTPWERVAAVVNGIPNIPLELDRQLMATLQDELGGTWPEEDARKAARNGFWSRIMTEPKDPIGPPP